jgi:hypothetical protein
MQIDLSWHGLTQPGSGRNYFGTAPLPPFNPATEEFDPVNAFWLSEICRLIYRRNPDEDPYRSDTTTRQDILKRVGCRETIFIRRRETQCALIQPVADAAQFAVLVFRGTTGYRNWLLDLDVRPERIDAGAIVHRGFLEALRQIWPELQPVLERVAAPCFFTGHSMGGALAQLAATRHRPRAVYCFGAPRVGDRSFVAMMRTIPVFRVVNHRDIVAMLPPTNQILAFKPAGRLIYICAQGLLRLIEDEDAVALACDEEAIDETKDESRWYGPPRFLADHAPINYSARIAQYLRDRPVEIREDNVCPQRPLRISRNQA